jgi:RNA recognition motif-containing protein
LTRPQTSSGESAQTTVYVCNLNNETTENSLDGFFKSKNLSVKRTRLLLDGAGKSKGAGFVEFHNTDDA